MTQSEASQPLIDAGMARQLEAFNQARAAGMPRLGWKIGINDPAAQERMGLTATLVGWLDGRRVFSEGQAYVAPPGARPRIEAEVAIRLAAGVGAGASLNFARSAIAGIAPAIEFVNATKPLTPLDELLANDILHDAVLFGAEGAVDLAAGLVASGFPAVSLNGASVREAKSGRYPEDLAEIVVHVANVLGRYGEALNAGDVIIGGSYIDPFDVAPGDRVAADFGALGRLEFEVA